METQSCKTNLDLTLSDVVSLHMGTDEMITWMLWACITIQTPNCLNKWSMCAINDVWLIYNA